MTPRYKSLFDEGKIPQSLRCCQDYLTRLVELKLPFPHRNHEIAGLALCSCLWELARDK